MRAYRKDHPQFGQCDPRKCPEEINQEIRGVPPRKRSLWRQVRKNDRPLVAQFRASSARFSEGQERSENPATRWLCWQSEANPSLPAIWGELQGDLAKLQGQCLHIPAEDPLHLSGLVGFLPNSRSRETKILSREGRTRITVPVFFEINSRVISDTRSRTRDVCFTPKSGHA